MALRLKETSLTFERVLSIFCNAGKLRAREMKRIFHCLGKFRANDAPGEVRARALSLRASSLRGQPISMCSSDGDEKNGELARHNAQRK